MSTNIKELEQSIELLLKEISEFNNQVKCLNECEENQINLKNKKQSKLTNSNDSNQKKFQEKETEFDQLNELFLRNKNITENETKINDLINTFQSQFSQIIKQAEIKKEEYGDKSNDLLI